MSFVLSDVYASANERQVFEPLIVDEPPVKINDKNSIWTELNIESTDYAKRSMNTGSNTTNVKNSLTRCVDFMDKWLSLSFEKEKRGIYFSVAF